MTVHVSDAMRGLLASVNDAGLRSRIATTIDRLIDSYRTVDVDARVALCAEDVLFVDPVGLPEIRGRDAMDAFFRACLDDGWSFSMTLDELVICSNEALMTWLVDIAKAGEGRAKLRSTNMMVFTDDGLIRGWRAIFDTDRILAGAAA